MISVRISRFVCLLAVAAGGPVAGQEWAPLAAELESVTGSQKHVYRLRDDARRSMDCLEIFQSDASGKGGVYGIYHSSEDGVFSVHLASSDDMVRWRHVTSLDDHASQATIVATGHGGYLLAYEKDAPNSCWIRLRHYNNLERLREGKYSDEFDVPRSLAPTAEGTPSFESLKLDGEDLAQSEIGLRFHFFEDVRVDQLASGMLTGFREWKAAPAGKINRELKKLGWRGNLGDRAKFSWRSKDYYLQEVQRRRGDWRSWRVYLCDRDGMPLRALEIATHDGARAFCNPNARWFVDRDGRRRLAVTMFLPSEGSEPSESGQLLYIIDPGGGP